MANKDAFYEQKEFDLITFGETMLRLSPPVNELISKSDSFKKHAGGAELNVACGVSLLGCRTGIITRLPKNQLGTFIKNRIRSSSVSDDFIIFDDTPEARVGIYYYENGAYPRKPTVVYDRKHSSITKIQENEIPEDIYTKTRMFYTSGITLALSENTRKLAISMIKKFKAAGSQIAFDVNYRANLWDEETARNTKQIFRLLMYFSFLKNHAVVCSRKQEPWKTCIVNSAKIIQIFSLLLLLSVKLSVQKFILSALLFISSVWTNSTQNLLIKKLML